MNDDVFTFLDDTDADEAPKRPDPKILAGAAGVALIALFGFTASSASSTPADAEQLAAALAAAQASEAPSAVADEGDSGDGDTEEAAQAAEAEGQQREAAARAAQEREAQANTIRGTVIQSNALITPQERSLDAAAITILRAYLAGSGPTVTGLPRATEDSQSWPDAITVEGIDRPHGNVAIASVLVTRLAGTGGMWDTATVERWAVPIRLCCNGIRSAGEPYQMPAPDFSPEPVEDLISDPSLVPTATQALEYGGYAGAEVIDVLRGEHNYPVIARAVVRNADGTTREADIWLRRHLRGLVVSGLPAPRRIAMIDQPAPVDAEQDQLDDDELDDMDQ